MKTNLIKIACAVFAVISFSCSSDSEDTATQELSLSQSVFYLPQMEGYNHKHVINYADNRKISELDYDGTGTMTSRKEITYGSGTSTTFSYDSQDAFVGKRICNYDSSGRIATMEFYNSGNQLERTRQYIYEGNDINVYSIENGISTLDWQYRTNSQNLLCYEKRMLDSYEQTINYANDTPSELFVTDFDNSNMLNLLNYEFYPTMKPLPLQNTITEMNNYSLISLSIQQMHETANYYLSKTYRPGFGFYSDYYKEFDSNNYITYAKISLVDSDGPHPSQERFYYYN
ncbi:hypothetical protein [Flavobacterium wongokense]|uniref:hypothetical protein n=1 Tax=Flavobacterium wongokense TaxID=2910674 RepID=UPI001F29AF4C|nr:hypothetical protein [Flavobacterium sp. WG47]MCF6130949.1 hypothetical protein [Flavobacterium sp. WG47]